MRITLATLAALSLLLSPSRSHAAWVGPVGNPVASSLNGCPTALIPDGAGGVLVAYQGSPVPGGAAIRLQRVTGDGEVAGGWPVDGVVACSLATTSPLGTLRGVSDGSGGAFLVWLENYNPPVSSFGTAYVQHVLASGQRATGWPARGRLLAGAAGQLCLNALADGAGGVIASWRDTRGGQVADIRVTRVSAGGTNVAGFPVAGRVVSEAVESASMQAPALVRDGTSGYWLSYTILSTDTLTTPSSNRLVRLTSNGVLDPLWLGNGFAAPSASNFGIMGGTAPLADGSGGAYLLSGGLVDDVRLFHVLGDLSSDPAWPDDGVALGHGWSIADGSSYRLAGDGAGGIFAAWPRPYPAASILALRRVHSDGSMDADWPAAQTLVGDWEPSLLADPGGAFVCGTWFYTCPSRDCIGVSGIGRRSTDGSIPASWNANDLYIPGQYGTPNPDSCQKSGPVAMISDGGSGVFASWTKPFTATASYYTAPATVRVMRFSALGPVADVPPGAGARPGATLRARWIAGSGIRAALAPVPEARRLDVCDLLGRRVASADVPATAIEVDIAGTRDLRAGLYFLRIRAPGGAERAKVLVTR